MNKAIDDLEKTVRGFEGYSDSIGHEEFESFFDLAMSNHDDLAREAVGRELARRLGREYPW